MKRSIWIVIIFVLLAACSEESKEKASKAFMQSARGEADEMIVVMDSVQWNGALGKKLRSILMQPVKGLPQDEPRFLVNRTSPLNLNTVLKSATNMVFLMTLDSKTKESNVIRGYFTDQSLKIIRDDSSKFMIARKDEFAKGQDVLYLFSNSETTLLKKLEQSRGQIQQFFEKKAVTTLRETLFKKRSKEEEKALKETIGASIKIPFGWDIAKQLPNFVWVRRLDVEWEQNIFIYKEPYTSSDVFDDVTQLRDKITESYLRDGEKNELFITRQDREDLKTAFIEQTTFKNKYAKQLRGLWKISNNSAGGPYISYTFVDEESQTLYYIEGYVYAPGGKKKNLMREVDAILHTFEASN